MSRIGRAARGDAKALSPSHSSEHAIHPNTQFYSRSIVFAADWRDFGQSRRTAPKEGTNCAPLN
jgi:hypothetical protein